MLPYSEKRQDSSVPAGGDILTRDNGRFRGFRNSQDFKPSE